MRNFIKVTYKENNVVGFLNVDKIYEILPLENGGTNIYLHIDKKAWSIWVNESIDEIISKINNI